MLSLLPQRIGPTMNFTQPWQLLLTILAGLINRQQQEVIEYLRTENQVLKEAHGKRRIRLNDDQRRLLAIQGKILGRKVLGEIGASFTPDTILRWHRQLVADKWDHSDHRTTIGRPRVRQEIVDLVLRMARVNPSWGYDRVQGALANLGHKISDTTIGNILRENGIEPVPEATIAFLAHYHGERNHQGLGNRLIAGGQEVGRAVGPIRCRERLGGMLRYYYREVA